MKYMYCVLLAAFAIGCASVPDQPRAESREARLQQTEQIAPTGVTPQVVSKPLPSTMVSGEEPLNKPVNSEQTTVAPVETETPAPVRPRRRVEQQVFYGLNLRPGGTLRLFSKEQGPIELKIEEVWRSDGRVLVLDYAQPPPTPPEQVLQGSEEVVWYASLGAWCQKHKLKLGAVVIMVLVILLCVLVRRIYSRAPARKYRDEPPQREQGNAPCLPPHPAATAPTVGLMTKEQFEAAMRFEQLRQTKAVIDADIETVRGQSKAAAELRRVQLETELSRLRSEQLLINSRVDSAVEVLAASLDTELARLSAERSGYEAYEEETRGEYKDDLNDDDLFAEETPADVDDDDRLSNSQTSDEINDDDIDHGNT